MDPIDGYLKEIFSRYNNLPENDKEVLKTLPDTPFASPLGKLLGPEMGELFSSIFPQEPTQETMTETTPPQQQMEQPVRRAGLGAR